jgi:serine/threonine-protein kinase
MAEVEADATRTEPSPDSLVGATLNGRFHIVKQIARGGMGCVYFATQSPLDRPVAVKVLQVDGASDAESRECFRRRFLLEASMLAKLQHPNIVTLLDYGQISGSPGDEYFMAMEYLHGETLASRFHRRGRMSIAESLDLGRQIGRGLREAHRHGFVHRDLKPSNIMLVPEDERNRIVKLVDFGIGKVIPRGAEPAAYIADETGAGTLLGSPRYMAPEQIRSEPVEPRTDLYGLGIILFQALTGRVPFDGQNFDVLLAHCLTPPPELADGCPDEAFPESLSLLVRALLEKDASDRPTIDQFLLQLGAVEEEIFGGIAGSSSSQRLTPITLVSAESPPSPRVGLGRRLSRAVSALRGDSVRGPLHAPVPAASTTARSRRTGGRKTLVGLSIGAFGMFALSAALGHFAATRPAAAAKAGRTSPEGASLGSIAARVGKSPADVPAFAATIDSTPSGASAAPPPSAGGPLDAAAAAPGSPPKRREHAALEIRLRR